MDLESFSFNGIIVHNMLLRQVTQPKHDKDELWFQIGQYLIWLLVGEWCLATRLSYNKDAILK